MAELAEHNNREWFSANKTRYEDLVKDPALRFIENLCSRAQEHQPALHGYTPVSIPDLSGRTFL